MRAEPAYWRKLTAAGADSPRRPLIHPNGRPAVGHTAADLDLPSRPGSTTNMTDPARAHRAISLIVQI